MIVLQYFGRQLLSFLAYLGQLAHLCGEIAYSLFRGQRRWKQLSKQVVEIGFDSQPIVLVTGAFTGAILSAQSLYQFELLNMETGAGGLVAVAMLRELGPTITAMMLSGRVGSAMAAEIGTMKVTDQIEALRSMAIHPIDYLVSPRFVAMVVSVPLLIAESAALGMAASYMVGVFIFGVDKDYWNHQLDNYVDMADFIVALTKGCVFGIIIVIVSCHQGLRTKNGAVGVGLATTKAMVYSCLGVLILNFFLTLLLQHFFPVAVT